MTTPVTASCFQGSRVGKSLKLLVVTTRTAHFGRPHSIPSPRSDNGGHDRRGPNIGTFAARTPRQKQGVPLAAFHTRMRADIVTRYQFP